MLVLYATATTLLTVPVVNNGWLGVKMFSSLPSVTIGYVKEVFFILIIKKKNGQDFRIRPGLGLYFIPVDDTQVVCLLSCSFYAS